MLSLLRTDITPALIPQEHQSSELRRDQFATCHNGTGLKMYISRGLS
jgi:hypothetical protein